MKNEYNLEGKRFGKLTVISRKMCDSRKRMQWYCKCECGNFTYVSSYDLLHEKTRSCGCYRKEATSTNRTTHGMSSSRLYRIWYAMKKRCYYESNAQYKDYGARGIKVCDEWYDSFDMFKRWAISNGYNDNLTIDRIDVDGNYCPSNCRWATSKEQCSNKRNNRVLYFNGKYQTLQQLSEETGIPYTTLLYRIKHGWSLDAAFSLKPYEIRKNRNHISISSETGQ